MKKLIVLLFAILGLLIFKGCEVCSTYPTEQIKYLTKTGNQWEYHSTMTIEYYDSLGNISSEERFDFGNTIVKIESANDTLNGEPHFILFTSYDLSTPENIHKSWYANPDSGFYVVAYSNAGSSQLVLPKGMNLDHQAIASIINSKSMQLFIPVPLNNNPSDSVLYFDPPRKVLKYPLKIGSRWIELVNPWHRERFVNEKETIQVPAGTFNCYNIESEWDILSNNPFIFTDYLNLQDGLVKRYVSIDSLVIITAPGDTVGYYKSTSISELVGKNF
jgi:hypothetical protein